MGDNTKNIKLLIEATSPQKKPVEYAYKIEPDIIPKWIYESVPSKLIFVNMSSQDYTINFKLKTSSGEWVKSLGIRINADSAKRRFWQILSSVLLLIAGGGYGIYHFRKKIMTSFLRLLVGKISRGNDKNQRNIAISAKLKVELLKLFEEEKIYRETNLSLNIVSSRLGVSTQSLSALVNDELKISFNDFVNGYRVREFISKMNLPETQGFTILAIAMDCGFNSKSSFNRAFKKVTGTTPSDYFKSRQCMSS